MHSTERNTFPGGLDANSSENDGRLCHTAPGAIPTKEIRTSTEQNPIHPVRYGRLDLFKDSYQIRQLEACSTGRQPNRPSPVQFLRKGSGRDLGQRRSQAKSVKDRPPHRDPPFVKGNRGLNINPTGRGGTGNFRRLYDLEHINFVSVRGGDVQQRLQWHGPLSDIDVKKWLPIFLEGISETQEPYRFIAIKGSSEMIEFAGKELQTFALDLVLPLRCGLTTKEPATVAASLCAMRQILSTDFQVAPQWIRCFRQFGSSLNLFRDKAIRVDMGYNSRCAVSLSEVVSEVLHLLHTHGGPSALNTIRKYVHAFQPAVDGTEMLRKGRCLRIRPYTCI